MGSRILSLLAFAALLLVACGGSVFSAGQSPPGDDVGDDVGPPDAATHDTGPGDGGGPDSPIGADAPPPWSPVCPATPPAIGSACTQETVQCEYGSAWWNVACDTVVQCQNARWTTYQASYEPCTSAPGPNPASCPATYADVPQGGTCSSGTCYYPQAVCSCQVPFGPVMIDGGNANWYCNPEPGCPMPRPRLGSACSIEGTSCTYETCEYGQTCMNGTWQSQPEGCAAAGGGP